MHKWHSLQKPKLIMAIITFKYRFVHRKAIQTLFKMCQRNDQTFYRLHGPASKNVCNAVNMFWNAILSIKYLIRLYVSQKVSNSFPKKVFFFAQKLVYKKRLRGLEANGPPNYNLRHRSDTKGLLIQSRLAHFFNTKKNCFGPPI